MRHQIGQKKLQRSTAHRMAMLKNMVASLLEHGRIKTTVPKAKAARPIAERMITLGKRGGLHNLRLAARTLPNKDLLSKVFGEYKERYEERTGGYTRIIRLGHRHGDAAEMALLELVDRPEGEEPEKKAKGDDGDKGGEEKKPAKKPAKKAKKEEEAEE
jgi:large subunit ribosomal protein L17